MIHFTHQPRPDTHHSLRLEDDRGVERYVSDERVGEVAESLLELEFLDGVSVHPTWVAVELTHRAAQIDNRLDASYDFDTEEWTDHRAGATGARILRVTVPRK